MSRIHRRNDGTTSHGNSDYNISGRPTGGHTTDDAGAVADTTGDDPVIDECIEELDELIMSLDRYPPATVAVAMGAHLEGLLGALIDEHLCTAEEVRRLLRRIECGALQEEREAPERWGGAAPGP